MIAYIGYITPAAKTGYDEVGHSLVLLFFHWQRVYVFTVNAGTPLCARVMTSRLLIRETSTLPVILKIFSAVAILADVMLKCRLLIFPTAADYFLQAAITAKF